MRNQGFQRLLRKMFGSFTKVAQVQRSLLVNKPKFQGKASQNLTQEQAMTTNHQESRIVLIGSLILIVSIYRVAQWLLYTFFFWLLFGVGSAYEASGVEPPGITSPEFVFGFLRFLPSLAVGIAGLPVSRGIFNRKGWAYMWAALIAALNFLLSIIYSVADYLINPFPLYVFMVIGSLLTFATFSLVIYLLLTPPVRRAFGKQ
jgi:hypothetical protein